MFIGVTITGLVGYSVLAWGIEMLVRVHDIPKTIAGQNFGIFNIFSWYWRKRWCRNHS